LNINFKNEDFIVDSGTYKYHTDDLWREYFRSTTAHNTLTIDNMNQSLSGGAFMWLKKADVKTHKTLINEEFDYIRVSHNGYTKQGINVLHQREYFLLKDKFILVIDKLINHEGKNHNYSQNWHINDECNVELTDKMSIISKKEEFIYLKTYCDEEYNQKLIKGCLDPVCGWNSTTFDLKNPASTIKINSTSKNNINLISLFFTDSSLKSSYTDKILSIFLGSENFSFDLSKSLFE
jgi:hypothetical protein